MLKIIQIITLALKITKWPMVIFNFYNIDSSLIDGVLYKELDPSIFEVKFPTLIFKVK